MYGHRIRAWVIACGALLAACVISIVVTSIAFNALDAAGFYDTGEDCRTLFCDVRWGRVVLTLAIGFALMGVLAVRLNRAAYRRWGAPR